MRRIAALIFALLALGLVAAGCGGGGDSTGSSSTADTSSSSESSEGGSSESGAEEEEAEDESGSEEEGGDEASAGGPAPSKAVFIKEADKVCSDADLKLSEEVLDYAKENGIDVEKEEEPSDDQKTEIYEQIVIPNIAKQAEELAALTPPKGDEGTIEDLTSTLSDEAKSAGEDPSNIDENAFKDASEKAQDYGLTSCGA
jgi:hypothetical protein